MSVALMSVDLVACLFTRLLWLAILLAVYTVLMLSIDAALAARDRRQLHRAMPQAELARIERRANTSVRRIETAFAIAQEHIRQEAVLVSGDHR